MQDKELENHIFNTKHNHRIQTAANSRSKSITSLQSWEKLESPYALLSDRMAIKIVLSGEFNFVILPIKKYD
jgi:hypothetical protein